MYFYDSECFDKPFIAPKDQKEGLSAGAISGIVIGAVAVIIVVAVVIYVLVKNKKKAEELSSGTRVLSQVESQLDF